MRKVLLITIISALSWSSAWAQESASGAAPKLGDQAPAFSAETTNGILDFPKDCGAKWKILFSHPADFTPVCSSELLELASMQDDFKTMGVDLVVVSTDRLDSHKQWIKSLETLEYKGRKTPDIGFPLVDDNQLMVAKAYGMIHPGNSSTKDVRGVFIIDPKNYIRAMFFYPMNIGRNTAEIKRTILALQTADKEKVLTPADWQAGNDVLLPYVKKAEGANAAPPDPDVYQVAWYMLFKKAQK